GRAVPERPCVIGRRDLVADDAHVLRVVGEHAGVTSGLAVVVRELDVGGAALGGGVVGVVVGLVAHHPQAVERGVLAPVAIDPDVVGGGRVVVVGEDVDAVGLRAVAAGVAAVAAALAQGVVRQRDVVAGQLDVVGTGPDRVAGDG